LTFVNVVLDADAVINNSSQKVGGSNAYPDPAAKKVGGSQWRRQDFVTGGEVRYGSIGGLGGLRSPPEADTFTAVHREFVGFDTV